MERADATGLGVSVLGHAALLAAAAFVVTRPATPPVASRSFEVSYVDEVGLTAASPTPAAPPAAAPVAPEIAAPEEAAPAPAPVRQQPDPRPAPPRPAPPRPSPGARPTPAPPRQATPTPPSRPQAAGTRARNSGSLLGPDLLRGIGNDRNSRSTAAPAAQMTGQAMANIGQVIQRQVQPCADRQVYPGPGAERITTEISLSLNPDGSLAARPRAGRQSGIDDENRRYAARVADLAIATFVGCSPLRGLPADLYAVPRGWRTFTMRYRLPG